MLSSLRSRFSTLLAVPGRAGAAQRRVSGVEGRTHIEVRGLHRPGTQDAARRVEEMLMGLPGVYRAEVNGELSRVTVWHDPTLVGDDELFRVLDHAEDELGLTGEGAPADATSGAGDRHPGDSWQWARHGVRMGFAVVGAGYATGARFLPVPPLPPAIPALATLVDYTPGLRTALESALGRELAGWAVELAGRGGNALAQEPVNLMIDAVERWLQLREALARYQAWLDWDETLAARPGGHRADPVLPPPPRPVPLPDGPVERVADRVGLAAFGSAAGLLLLRSPDRALGLLRAGVTRAARLGRNAFAAQLGTGLAGRDVLALDPAALRRLDRVSCVVLDANVLLTSRHVVDRVLALNGNSPAAEELTVRVHELLDPDDPGAARRGGGWGVAPLDRSAVELPSAVATELGSARRGGAASVGITKGRRLVGVATVVRELDPLAEGLLAAARQVGEDGQVIVAGSTSGLGERLAVPETVAGGSRLAASIRRLQDQGHVVALVSARSRSALAAADVGIAVAGRTPTTPWEGDLLTGPGLAGACAVLRAVPLARTVSHRSAQLAWGGSVLGGLLAGIGPAAGAGVRAAMPVHGMSLFSLALGTWYATAAGRVPEPAPTHGMPWHAMPAPVVLAELESTALGLDAGEAARRAGERLGELVEEQEPGLLRAVLDELANPITPALAAGAGVAAGIGAAVDAVMIGAALGISALLGGAQQVGAQRALRRLGERSMVPVAVRRGEQVADIDPDELVPGDVVELQAGDAVPADCRLISEDGLEVDEAALTGESQLVTKVVEATPEPAVADRHCMLYQGTVIAAGSGAGVVVATGADTEVGRTALGGGKAPATGVQRRLQALTRSTLRLSIGAGVTLFGVDLLRGRSAGQSLGRAVSLAVAAVPEGLPFVATVAELAAARRLSARGALVRNSSTIEALGRVDTLCFDKTGTLTVGSIALRRVSDGQGDVLLTELDGTDRTIVAAALRATPGGDGNGTLAHRTDQAVVDGAAAIGVTPLEGAAEWARVDEMHFEPSRGFHAVLGSYLNGRSGAQRLSVKGAPEIVLDRCTSWARGDHQESFDAGARRIVDAEAERLARRGYRVLAVAEREASDRADLDDERIGQLRLLGLLALADPVRPAAAEAVRQLQHAGVTVVMVTGDHPTTAEAIAAELEVLNGSSVCTGPELDRLDDEELAALLPHIAVFARVSPEQKARIVRLLQESGRVVAVTGDGANDAPAIRLADVGIALGADATPASREAADLVVTDDAMETITAAVVEGRAMWVSVRDALAVLLGGNLGEIVFTVGSGLLGAGQTLNARQLLLVNLLTDALPAMAIAVQPPPGRSAEALLAEGPETSLGQALNRDIYRRAVLTAGGAGVAWTGATLLGCRGQSSTVALVGLVSSQLGQTMTLRGRAPLVLGAGALSLLALLLVVQTPGLSHLFGCRPLGPRGWGIALSGAALATAAGVLTQRTTGPSVDRAARTGPC